MLNNHSSGSENPQGQYSQDWFIRQLEIQQNANENHKYREVFKLAVITGYDKRDRVKKEKYSRFKQRYFFVFCD